MSDSRLPGGSHICAGSSKLSGTYSFERRSKEIPSRRGRMKKELTEGKLSWKHRLESDLDSVHLLY